MAKPCGVHGLKLKANELLALPKNQLMQQRQELIRVIDELTAIDQAFAELIPKPKTASSELKETIYQLKQKHKTTSPPEGEVLPSGDEGDLKLFAALAATQ